MDNQSSNHTAAIALIQQLLGDRLSLNADVRATHGKDFSHHPGASPDAVAFVQSTDEVVGIVNICRNAGTPIIPFGVGTSLEGHITAPEGGVCIDLSQMNQIIKVNASDLDVVVEPGVTRKQLNAHLRDQGLFFPIDPGADATLGGMSATAASGTNAVRYGTMRDNVLSLEVVLANGEVIETAHRARKSSSGYDLTRLFVGSEGTLGIITKVTLRLYGITEAISVATSAFDTLEGAIQCVIDTIQIGVPIARIELLDEASVEATNLYAKMDLPLKPTLFLEFHGSPSSVREQAETVEELANAHGAHGFEWTQAQEDRNRLWQARHDAAYAASLLAPGKERWITDVCVPISRLADCILETQEDIKTTGLIAPIIGHVGDGNFHVAILADPEDAQECAKAEALHDRMVARALAMDGTCTGEHGIGAGKRHYLRQEHGAAVEVMRAIKTALDPTGIMNPGKVLPD